jgi:SAM-dependent methyltransferase
VTTEVAGRPICPGCHGFEWHEISGQDESYSLRECPTCGCCRIAAASVPDEGLYDSYYAGEDAQRLSGIFDVLWRWKRRARARLILRHAPARARVCDIGCERGELLNLLKQEGCVVAGTQVSQVAAEFAQRQFGIEVYVGEVMDAPFAKGPFDVVLMLNVLEHVPDPERYVAHVARMLVAGGAFWVEVPNVASPTARWAGKRWLHHDHAHHLWGFSLDGLARLLRRHGFTIDRRYAYTWEHGPIGALQSWLNMLPGSPNVIFGIVQHGLSRKPWRLAVQLVHIAISAVLLPFAVLAAVLEGIQENPQVVLLRASLAIMETGNEDRPGTKASAASPC